MTEEIKLRAPLLPLRGIVIYPAMVLNLDVGRKKSINAVKYADKHEKYIFLVSQRDEGVESPTQEELFEIGTMVRIKTITDVSNGTLRILVEALYRGKIVQWEEQDDVDFVEVEKVEDVLEDDLEIKAMSRGLIKLFTAYNRMSKAFPKEAVEAVTETKDPVQLVDLIASMLPLKLKHKQEILEATDVKTRLMRLMDHVRDERELAHLEKKIAKQVRSNVERTQKEYFLREQMKAIQEELSEGTANESEMGKLLQELKKKNVPREIFEVISKEVKRYETIPMASPEKSILRNYLDWMMQLPWSEQTDENVDIALAEQVLNEDHYGLEKVKERILEFLAVQKLTKSMKGPILCLVGPPGVGKTSLARSIARAIDRNFVRISLGGVHDESEIRGHRRTYVGAMPGRIIQGMKKAGTINPLFLLDEIDKMASNLRGDPAAAMLEVLDPAQNKSFTDHYIGEPYDLSKVLFVATANSLSSIPTPLLDRMEVIELSGYTEMEKVRIAMDHILPRQIKENGLKKSTITVKEEAVLTIVRYYTRESGVRSLERVLGTLCRKVAKIIVAGERKSVTVSNKNLEDILGRKQYSHGKAEMQDEVGVVTGLAYTSVGGDTLSIEVTTYPGKGRLKLTGQLGDVMKESAEAAYSYVRGKSPSLRIEENFFEKNEIHIHVPAGAIPKDGPSAGITMATALVSALTNQKVRCDVGMTGEITLRGRVLPIGGLKEKSLSAHRAGLTTVILPKDNEKDIDDIPASVRQELTFIPVSHVDEVLKIALVGDKE